MSENASATYRGFRNQALYALYRLLTDRSGGERIYRPEGAEDLAVFNSQMDLIEVIQVKDYSNDLSLSALNPNSDAGFFARLKRRIIGHPNCTTKLASFGPLGPELAGAIEGNANHRAKVVEKLCSSNESISAADATIMLNALNGNVVHPASADLLTAVMQALQETSVAGELQLTIELLMYWVFDASENRRDLTKNGLLLQLERIGSYLTTLRDNSAEWNVSVLPIKALVLRPEDRIRLIVEYRQGVQARWEHIAAGADCARTERLWEIHRQMENHPVVIVRGASGQGKSTLGWRYIHDFCAEGIRFHVRLVEGREHAMRIANALGAHVRKLDLKAIAYLDVSPSDSGWSELVRELATAGLKVLIAVREEDFRRANIAVGDFDYVEVVLDRVTKEEAEPIYFALKGNSQTDALDFEEAWARFASKDGGPLLEFTHLASEGESLEARIASQIRRIQNDAVARANGLTQAHLELLALAAVANETGARVGLAQLCDAVGLSSLTNPLRVLENEYLLRVQDDGGNTSVGGLHALRSKAVVQALFSTAPELWENYAIRVLPLVIDEDLGNFLLAAFSRKPECGNSLFEHICGITPRSWTHAGSIAGALIWEGVSRYENRNREAILAALNQFGSAWWLVCDSHVGIDGNAYRDMLQMMNNMLNAEIQTIPFTPKREVFDLFTSWASNVGAPPHPGRLRDWPAAGDVAYWIGHTAVEGALRTAIEALLPRPLPARLSVEELGLYVSGRARIGDAAFTAWHDQERHTITQRFLHESDSVHIDDDGHHIKVYFSVPIADSVTKGKSDAHDWNEQTMKRIRLLRFLFPNRETFGAQGIGLELLVEQMGHDPTSKEIPAQSLPPERSVRLNATFISLVAYRHSRPDTWKGYANAALAFREELSACFRKLYRGWAKLLSESPPRRNTITQLPGAELDRLKVLSNLPMFPRSAVDEWGFLSEQTEKQPHNIETMQQASLKRFNRWRKVFADFETGAGMVTSKIIDLTALYAAEHKGHIANEADEKNCRLFLINLAAAWEVLSEIQKEFRTRFGGLYPQDRLVELEIHERSNFKHLWPVAFAMRYERQRHLPDIGQRIEADIARRRTHFLQSLKAEVTAALGNHGTADVRETPWILNEIPHLCVVCDYHNPTPMETTTPRIVEAVWRATQAGGWRPYEWKPLEIEWPKIALVSLLRGKALASACVSLSAPTFFGTTENFDVKPYHCVPLAAKPSEFELGGFDLWESPLLRTVLELKVTVQEFGMTNFRYYKLLELILRYSLEENDVARILGKFSYELGIVLATAQRSYSQTQQILEVTANGDIERWKEKLRRSCQTLLLSVEEESSVSLNLDIFTSWMTDFGTANEEFRQLISEITVFALGGDDAE